MFCAPAVKNRVSKAMIIQKNFFIYDFYYIRGKGIKFAVEYINANTMLKRILLLIVFYVLIIVS